MGTEDAPQIKMIDSALYHLQPSTTPFATPFTYNNGITILEILERIRTAVIDVIRYTNSFGEDVNKMVQKVNESADKWQKDAQKTIDDLMKYDNESKKYQDEKRAEADKVIADFTSTLLKVALMPKEGGNYVEAEMKDGSKVDLLTRDGRTALLVYIKKDITRLDNRVAELQDGTYTKRQCDQRFVINENLTSMGVIGGTNAVYANKWTGWMARSLGLGEFNCALEGGGFTSRNSNSFSQQLANLKERVKSEEDRKRFKYILVADMIYDINERNSIAEFAPTFFTDTIEAFPNAQILVLPVIFNFSTINNDLNKARSVTSRIAEISRVGARGRVPLVASGSAMWLHDANPSARALWNKNGQDSTVLLSEQGYVRVEYNMLNFVKTGNSERHTENVNLGPFSEEYVHNEYNFLNIGVRGDVVSIQGTFRTGPNKPSADTMLMRLPGTTFVYGNTTGMMWGGDRQIYPIYVKNIMEGGGLYTGAELPENMTFNVNFHYRIF